MKHFMNCKTLDELKAEYRRLIKIHHPDCGGDAETMKGIDNACVLRPPDPPIKLRRRGSGASFVLGGFCGQRFSSY